MLDAAHEPDLCCCLDDCQHTPLNLVEELVRRTKRGNAADSLTDCPAQHGGAKRQHRTDVAALPKRGTATRYLERRSEILRLLAVVLALDVSVMMVDEKRNVPLRGLRLPCRRLLSQSGT